jgi:hypothetical protein
MNRRTFLGSFVGGLLSLFRPKAEPATKSIAFPEARLTDAERARLVEEVKRAYRGVSKCDDPIVLDSARLRTFRNGVWPGLTIDKG